MHLEFCDSPEDAMELLIMATHAQIERGVEPKIALENNGLTLQQYNYNVDKVYHRKENGLPSWIISI
ncbi:MAG: hypothetical protein LBR64_08765 [Dysgonamonadaceae bacterium]|nr:hypothetical protein [Dysgonamonadaceae bacterium]